MRVLARLRAVRSSRLRVTAALGSGSAPRPSLPQPRPRAPRLILGSGPSRFEATHQPSSGPLKAADLRPQPAHRYGLLPLAASVRLQRCSLLPRCALLAALDGVEDVLVTTLVPWYCCVELAPRASASTTRLLQAALAPSRSPRYLPISPDISLHLPTSPTLQAALASALCAAACRLGRAATRAILAACTR